MAKETNEARIKALEEGQVKIISMLESMVKKPEEPARSLPVEATAPVENGYPIPSEYREILLTTFNKEFGLRVTPMADTPAFQIDVVIPKKYSPLTEEQYRMNGGDLRSKVVTYAEASNGVKQWVQTVFNNFDPEVRALILADK